VVVEDFIIPDETPSQKTRRVPITHIGRDSNSNSSSTTQSKRMTKIYEGTEYVIRDDADAFPQRQWLCRSRGFEESRNYKPQDYILDSLGGKGSFVYMIDTGLNADHDVSNFFRFVGLFK
jgi:hypothetical protein